MTAPYYQDDLVTLFHGNCREITAWLDADVLVTDPPYGVDRRKYNRKSGGSEAPAIAGEDPTGWGSDRVVDERHVQVRNAALAMWGSRPALVFGSWRAPRPATTRMRLIWDRKFLGNGGVRPWRPVDEEIYVVGDWPNSCRGPRGDAVPSVLRYQMVMPTSKDRLGHPTPKPLGLMEHLVESCPPGVVADPFTGSGTTLLAAKLHGRRAIGVEIEERYCELTAKRLSQDALPFGEAS